jgi:hypothetical protein
MTPTSRRNFLALAAALLAPATAESRSTTAYRIDATILALGLPVYKRRGAGCAFVHVRQEQGAVHLQFAAGSWPEQARGLNRYGSLEESVTAQDASWFGFMTSSPDKDVRNRDAQPCTATRGRLSPFRAEIETMRVQIAPDLTWSRSEELYRRVNTSWRPEPAQQLPLRSATPTPFLYAVRAGLLQGQTNFRIEFHHNAQPGELELHRDGELVHGRITIAQKVTPFRLWTSEGSAIPFRIEYEPMRILRLTMERES